MLICSLLICSFVYLLFCFSLTRRFADSLALLLFADSLIR
jgi:hypothetical protein